MLNKEVNRKHGVAPFAVVINALIILGGGYLLLRTKSSSPEPTPAPEQTVTTPSEPTPPPEPIATALVNITMKMVGKSGEQGTTTISSLDNGKTKVEIALDGEPADASQPAHIHEKSCKQSGAVKYSLNDVVGGVSETVLDVAVDELLKTVPLSANVHQSADKLNVYEACGDITAKDKTTALDIFAALQTPVQTTTTP